MHVQARPIFRAKHWTAPEDATLYSCCQDLQKVWWVKTQNPGGPVIPKMPGLAHFIPFLCRFLAQQRHGQGFCNRRKDQSVDCNLSFRLQFCPAKQELNLSMPATQTLRSFNPKHPQTIFQTIFNPSKHDQPKSSPRALGISFFGLLAC